MRTINQSNFQAAFVNTTNKPIKSEFISYFVTSKMNGDSHYYVLNKLVKDYYKHPDCEDVLIPILNTYFVEQRLALKSESAPFQLAYLTQETLKEIVPLK